MKKPELFDYIDSKLSFRLITPVNMRDENLKLRTEILNGKIYHPVYQYPEIDGFNFEEMKQKLLELRFDGSTIGRFYEEIRTQKIGEVEMFQSVSDEERFTAASQKLYGLPELDLQEECLHILELPTQQEDEIYSAYELKQVFEQLLFQYGLLDWDILITDQMGSKVMVGAKKIWINSNYRYSENDRKRLCAHEISTHVLRYENGIRREDSIFAEGTASAMDTEEGLAIYNEELAGAMNLLMLKTYAARYLCTIWMNDLSLYELVIKLKEFVGLDQAIYIASRVKVGLCDTSKPGGFHKDQIYMKGYRSVKDAVKKDASLYQKLYFGRISLKDLSRLEKQMIKAQNSKDILLPHI